MTNIKAYIGMASGYFAAVFPLVDAVSEVAQAVGAVAGAALSLCMLRAYMKKKKTDKSKSTKCER